MIKENIVLPTSILLDERRFTYQERMFIYFWASRSLSHEFNFTIPQYALFRGFPLQSCASNLRSILKRLRNRKLLTFSISKDDVFVVLDQSFNLSNHDSSIYINKNEINSLPSVVSLRIFEILCCLSVNSFSITMPIDAFKKMVGIQPAMYGTNASFYNRLVKTSLIEISDNTRISVKSEFDGESLMLYVVSQM